MDDEPGESVRNGRKPRHRANKNKTSISEVASEQRSEMCTQTGDPTPTSLAEFFNGIASPPKSSHEESLVPLDLIENSLRTVSLKSLKKEKLNDCRNNTSAESTPTHLVASTLAQLENPVRDGPLKSKKNGNLNGSRSDSTPDTTYPPYLEAATLTQLESLGVVFCGKLRINQKFSQDAYLASPDQGPDFVIEGIRDRNRSLEGDEVYAIVKPKRSSKSQNTKSSTQFSAVVVGIRQPVHSRLCIGTLSPFFKNKKYSTLIPCDSRLPKLRIMENLLPKGYLKHPMSCQESLFASQIVEWDDVRFAYGGPLKCLGMAGTAGAETEAIIMKYGLDVSQYPEHFNRFFPPTDYVLPPVVLAGREDCRQSCIFTIDPETAKDLDDAMSCDIRPDGSLTVGVHIADVSFFLLEGTELDQAVANRATTVYLVDKVYHMLPRDLCALCSLSPGADKLAFSVFFDFSPIGELMGRRFRRSVINSCVQLSYEMAQGILDETDPVLPPLENGFSRDDIESRVRALNMLAKRLRAARVEAGALRIDQVKVSFVLDPIRGKPVDFVPQEQLAAHWLIEEFMLLANTTVAEFIQEALPDLALLRHHPPPLPEYLSRLQSQLERYGVPVDISSSRALQSSLARLSGDSASERAQLMVINNALAKPMTRANYFCSKFLESADERRHYALSVPVYTHFTSPIRRYADVMVHHLLATALRLRPMPEWTPDYVQRVASHCNLKKYNAKLAGDASSDLFFALFVGEQGSLVTEAVVCYIGGNSFEALVLATGTLVKVYYDTIDGTVSTVKEETFEATVYWNDGSQQKIDVFSIVALELTRGKGIALDGRLLQGLIDYD